VAARRPGPADDGVAHGPHTHLGAEVDHPPGVLVAADGSRPAPAVEDEVEVAAAHAAVADLDEHVPRPGLRHRPLLDLEATGAAEDGSGHRCRQHGHGRERI
jgi:hypothetical protein